MADFSGDWAPQLVVHWCEPDAPTPAATPTPTPATPTPTPVLGSCQLNEDCPLGACVSRLTEAACVLTALAHTCTALSWSPGVTDCSAPATDTGCCALTGLVGSLCVGTNGVPGIMALTEAGCQAICAAIEQWVPDCSPSVWGAGQECGEGGCVDVSTPTPTP